MHYNALRREGELNTRELREEVTGKNTAIKNVLDSMARGGKITATQEGKETLYSIAEIPVEGKEAA
ncbi:MAG: hypothetical protein HY234_07490 [Acidobacteria bacterium]|nr:hypothetical protein [Acidobacteriota bacterium]MBI3662876.1 hypothetical protein [Acidobacteriota bacterium]